MKCNTHMLESIEKGEKITPKELTVVTKEDGTMTRPEEMKFKEKYSRYLTQVEKIETQLKQCYFKYFGQCNNGMKTSLEEDP
mmetsp:Transcript_15953/g.33707  ORF Transcript_15953/g.33707 Transcript_15953/m.33707 type:complete len:82 (+) Transcript_15953:387-632(+)